MGCQCLGPKRTTQQVYIKLMKQMYEQSTKLQTLIQNQQQSIFSQKQKQQQINYKKYTFAQLYDMLLLKFNRKGTSRKLIDNLSSRKNKIQEAFNFNMKALMKKQHGQNKISRMVCGLLISDLFVEVVYAGNRRKVTGQFSNGGNGQEKDLDSLSCKQSTISVSEHSLIAMKKQSVITKDNVKNIKNISKLTLPNNGSNMSISVTASKIIPIFDQLYLKMINFLLEHEQKQRQNNRDILKQVLKSLNNLCYYHYTASISCDAQVWKIIDKLMHDIMSKNNQQKQISCRSFKNLLQLTKDKINDQHKNRQNIISIILLWLQQQQNLQNTSQINVIQQQKQKQSQSLTLQLRNSIKFHAFKILQTYLNRFMYAWQPQFIYETIICIYDYVEFDVKKMSMMDKLVQNVFENYNNMENGNMKQHFKRSIFYYLIGYISISGGKEKLMHNTYSSFGQSQTHSMMNSSSLKKSQSRITQINNNSNTKEISNSQIIQNSNSINNNLNPKCSFSYSPFSNCLAMMKKWLLCSLSIKIDNYRNLCSLCKNSSKLSMKISALKTLNFCLSSKNMVIQQLFICSSYKVFLYVYTIAISCCYNDAQNNTNMQAILQQFSILIHLLMKEDIIKFVQTCAKQLQQQSIEDREEEIILMLTKQILQHLFIKNQEKNDSKNQQKQSINEQYQYLTVYENYSYNKKMIILQYNITIMQIFKNNNINLDIITNNQKIKVVDRLAQVLYSMFCNVASENNQELQHKYVLMMKINQYLGLIVQIGEIYEQIVKAYFCVICDRINEEIKKYSVETQLCLLVHAFTVRKIAICLQIPEVLANLDTLIQKSQNKRNYLPQINGYFFNRDLLTQLESSQITQSMQQLISCFKKVFNSAPITRIQSFQKRQSTLKKYNSVVSQISDYGYGGNGNTSERSQGTINDQEFEEVIHIVCQN